MVKIRDKNELKCLKIGFKPLGWCVSILLILPISLYAETTDNLIINGTFENGNANGWTQSGDGQVINDCCGSQYDYEFGDSGSIEQDFNLTSDSVTQSILNNGVQLDSSILVQNGEGGEGGWAGNNRGGADSFTIRLQIKDVEQNVLSTTTQTRITTTDIVGEYFTDSVIYSGVGSNIGNIKISGTDANAPSTLGGANIDNVSVTMTYDPVVLTQQQTQEIAEIFEEIEEVFTQEEFTQIQELVFEEIYIEPVQEEVFVESIQEMPELTLEEQFVEETIVLSPVIMEEEIIEAPVEMVEETVVEESTMESVVESEMEVEESIEVAEEVFEEMIAEAPIEQETTIQETEEISNEEETVEETEGNAEVVESNTDVVAEEGEVDNESGSVETQLTIEDITIKVADKIKTTEGQLKAVSLIVAKVMSNNNKIDSYSQVNAEIFKQPVIMDRNIDSYFSQTYVDVRNIYNDRTYEDRQDWISR